MRLLCLLAVLSGAPLRHAEAAEDLARALAELGCAHVIEEVDGGVGDDSGECVLKAEVDAHADSQAVPLSTARLALPLPAHLHADVNGRRPGDRPALPPPDTARRHAWLQCFLC